MFHRMNDVQWRFGILNNGHSITIMNSEKYEMMSAIIEHDFVIVRQEEGGDFVTLGREVEVDLEPLEL